LWWSGKIQKRLQAPFHTASLLLDDLEVFSGQTARFGLFAIRLHEHLNRGKRVAQFMGHTGSHLAHRDQLIGAQHLPLALLELCDHPLDLPNDPLHLLVDLVQIAVCGQDHGGQGLAQFPSGILDAHA
jgi:hypothetical protein